jgi:hypothetical protein
MKKIILILGILIGLTIGASSQNDAKPLTQEEAEYLSNTTNGDLSPEDIETAYIIANTPIYNEVRSSDTLNKKIESLLFKSFSTSYDEVVGSDKIENLFDDSMNVFVTDSKEGYEYSYYNKTYLETMDLIYSRIDTFLKNETLILSTTKTEEKSFFQLDDEDVVITYTITEGSSVWDHRVIFYFWNNKITGVQIEIEGV